MNCACDHSNEIFKPCELHRRWMLSEIIRPLPMILFCPSCHTRHIDVGYFAEKHHHTHACQQCGFVWRPSIDSTVGVQFLPGFKND